MIGIDIAKDKLDVYILQNKEHFIVDNNTSSIKSMVNKLKKNKSLSMMVFEPTGCYSKELEVFCLLTMLFILDVLLSTIKCSLFCNI